MNFFSYLSINKYKKRIEWIDVARALSMFIILYAHIYDSSTISKFVHLFHVPIFFFLSGIVWKEKKQSLKESFKNAFLTLLVPYFFCSCISIILFIFLGKMVSAKADSLSLFQCVEGMIYSNSRTGLMSWNRPLWFIPCLFSVKMLWELISRLSRKESLRSLCVAIIFSVGVVISIFFQNIILPFELEISFVMLGFYYLGIKLNPYCIIFSKLKIYIFIILFFVSLALCIIIFKYNTHISVQYNTYGFFPLFILGAIVGITMIVSLSGIISKIKVLQFVGQNTLSNLLWHKFPILLFQISPIGKHALKSPDSIKSILLGLFVVIIATSFSLFAAFIFSILSKSITGKNQNDIAHSANRDYVFDNIKGLLIILVVFGHLLAGDGNANMNLYGITHYLIYAVHMPMFIFISGYFSKSDYSLKKFIKGILIPYISFDIIFNLFNLVGGGDYNFIIIIADNVYWYILCIGLMRLLNKYTKNSIIVVIVSVIISFISFRAPENIWRILSLGRVFLLYPLFYIGVNLTPNNLLVFKKHKVLSIVTTVICFIIEFVLLYYEITSTHWATHNQPTSVTDLLLKYLFMGVFTFGCFIGLFALSPNRKIPLLSKCGRNSVMIYLIHMIPVKIIFKLIKVLKFEWDNSLFIVLLVLSILISYILSAEFISKIYKWYLNQLSKLFKINT